MVETARLKWVEEKTKDEADADADAHGFVKKKCTLWKCTICS